MLIEIDRREFVRLSAGAVVCASLIAPRIVFGSHSATELDTQAKGQLAALAESLLPPAAKASNRVVEAIEVQMAEDEAFASDLRRLLGLFSSSLFVFLFAGTFRSYAELDEEGRRKMLNALGSSRIAQLRMIAQGTRALVYATYYSDPSSWDAIGYPGPPDCSLFGEDQWPLIGRKEERP